MKHFRLLAIILAFLLTLYFFPLFGAKWLVIKKVEKKTGAKVEIRRCQLSWFGPQLFENIHFKTSEIEGTIEQLKTDVPLWRLSEIEGEFTLTQGHFTFQSELFGQAQLEHVEASLHQKKFSVTGDTSEDHATGSFEITGTIHTFPSSFSLEGNLSSFPTFFLDRLLKADGLLVEALGTSFDLQGSAQATDGQGVANIALSSSQCKTDLYLKYDRRYIYLRDPLIGTLKLTPGFSGALMREVNPLFLTGIRAKDPIEIRVESEGFIFPYNPFVLSHLKIERATLDMGRIRVANGPSLQTVIAFLKANPLKDLREMNAWFAPFQFGIENGIVHTQRLDFLLDDSIHLCTWGTIDLNRDKLQMYLGIPAETLAHSFGLKGLNPNYVKKIPIRGSTKEPELQSGPAAAEIAALVASQRLPIPGKAGKIIGGIANSIVQLKNDPDVPPPQRPFPWE